MLYFPILGNINHDYNDDDEDDDEDSLLDGQQTGASVPFSQHRAASIGCTEEVEWKRLVWLT